MAMTTRTHACGLSFALGAAIFLLMSSPSFSNTKTLSKSRVSRSRVTARAVTSARGRRDAVVAGLSAPLLCLLKAKIAEAKGTEINKIFVAGATGNTGKRTVDYLKKTYPGVSIVAGVRSVEKAKKMGLDQDGVEIRVVDLGNMNTRQMQDAIDGVDAVVCVTGFVPSNPLQMSKEAHKVDNEGTIKLVDAAREKGVSKFVLISSILTNGRAIGQQDNIGFKVTNAFGGVLDEKLVAENYLRSAGIDYTIVRPGGLKDSPPSGTLLRTGEDKLFGGDISRDTVAKVLVESVFDQTASNTVIEIVEQ
ncbi:hypothetical protein AAMO2058_001587000 [Amorphochlora amoebiformis]